MAYMQRKVVGAASGRTGAGRWPILRHIIAWLRALARISEAALLADHSGRQWMTRERQNQPHTPR